MVRLPPFQQIRYSFPIHHPLQTGCSRLLPDTDQPGVRDLDMTKQIRSLTRAIKVIEALNHAGQALSLHTLHQDTELDRATLLRILATLIDAGWVYRSLGDGCYRLTFQLHEMGTHIRPENSLAQLAAPIMEALQRKLHWPSDLMIYNGERMEIIETTRRQSPLFLPQGFMGYQPYMLQSATGRAFLAWSHPDDQKTILQRLQRTDGPDASLAQDEAWVQHLLEETRQRGFAERDRHYFGGPDDSDAYEVQVIAIPIKVMGDVQVCLNLTWIEELVQPEQLETLFLPQLRQAADQIAKLMLENELY